MLILIIAHEIAAQNRKYCFIFLQHYTQLIQKKKVAYQAA